MNKIEIVVLVYSRGVSALNYSNTWFLIEIKFTYHCLYSLNSHRSRFELKLLVLSQPLLPHCRKGIIYFFANTSTIYDTGRTPFTINHLLSIFQDYVKVNEWKTYSVITGNGKAHEWHKKKNLFSLAILSNDVTNYNFLFILYFPNPTLHVHLFCIFAYCRYLNRNNALIYVDIDICIIISYIFCCYYT